jgi:hypothetical protein
LVKRGREGREKAVGFSALAASLRRAATASFPSAARVVTFHFCPGCFGGERECLECRLASTSAVRGHLNLASPGARAVAARCCFLRLPLLLLLLLLLLTIPCPRALTSLLCACVVRRGTCACSTNEN